MLRRLRWILVLLVVVVRRGRGHRGAHDEARVERRPRQGRRALAGGAPVTRRPLRGAGRRRAGLVTAGGPDRGRHQGSPRRAGPVEEPGRPAEVRRRPGCRGDRGQRPRGARTPGPGEHGERRLNGNAELIAAFQAFDTKTPQPANAVAGYNQAVRAYQRERKGTVHSAGGLDPRLRRAPELLLGPDGPARRGAAYRAAPSRPSLTRSMRATSSSGATRQKKRSVASQSASIPPGAG